MEGRLGVGGGMVSEESQRNLDIGADLARKRRPREALPYIMEAIKDQNNLDAMIELAFLRHRPHAIQTLELAESRGRNILKERLGPKCFDDDGEHVGHFWSILDTRPYMRVMQALVRLYFEEKRYEKSTNIMIEMLRFCPGDNMAQRTWLGSNLIRVGRLADALYFAQTWLSPGPADRGEDPLKGGTDFKAPSRDPMTEARAKRLESDCGSLLYTAALASFKLWGDSLQAQQYLRAASKANPNILMRILGRVTRPDELNNSPRSLNGPEDAHDYLWLSQDLWMVPEVWNWANSDPGAKESVLKTCSREGCGKRETKATEFKLCSGCRLAFYCNSTCQKEDWKKHKPACRERQSLKAASRAMFLNKPIPKDGPLVFSSDFSQLGITIDQGKTRRS